MRRHCVAATHGKECVSVSTELWNAIDQSVIHISVLPLNPLDVACSLSTRSPDSLPGERTAKIQ